MALAGAGAEATAGAGVDLVLLVSYAGVPALEFSFCAKSPRRPGPPFSIQKSAFLVYFRFGFGCGPASSVEVSTAGWADVDDEGRRG